MHVARCRADGIYHPGSFNDRLLLGLKGTMSEAELHVLSARLDGGIRNKAARGELRRGLPVGLVWGEERRRGAPPSRRGDPRRDHDDLRAFRRARLGPSGVAVGAPRGRPVPVSALRGREPEWVTPSYHQIHSVPTRSTRAPTRSARRAASATSTSTASRARGSVTCRRADWEVLICDHHPGFIDREAFEANQQRIARNTRPRAHEAGGAVREGAALLQGLAVCGRCGRNLKVHYHGRRGQARPAYHCPGSVLVEGRGQWCLRVGGGQIDEAVTGALLAALTPAGIKAALRAAEALEADHDAALEQWRLQVERARYQAERAERRYRQVEPEHRLVARGLERDWEQALAALAAAEAELAMREHQRPRTLTADERAQLLALGADLGRVWSAPTTTDRDRKQLLRCLIEEVVLDVTREQRRATLTMRWRGGAITELVGATPAPSADDPHRRRHDRAARTARRPLRRRHERRDPQPPRTSVGDRRLAVAAVGAARHRSAAGRPE